MIVGLTELKTFYIVSDGEEIGRVCDILLPRGEWVVRYIAAWSEEMGRNILLPCSCLQEVDRDKRTIRADVQRSQVEESPDMDLTKQIERQAEQELYEYYGWPPYWLQEEQDVNPTGVLSGEAEKMSESDQSEFQSPELQPATNIAGAYAVHSNEGEFGILQDILVDAETCTVQYLAVDTPDNEGSILVETDHVSEIDWIAREVYLSLPADMLLDSPVYRPQEPLTPELERSLHEYYDRIRKNI